MLKRSIGFVAALLCAASIPALAQPHRDRDHRNHGGWDRIGEVHVTSRHDRDRQPVRLGGPIEGVQLVARGNDVRCRSVTANFGNGNDREIFQGELRSGQARRIDLPGDRRNVRSLDFNCSVRGRRDATIQISANIGRYRGDWQRNPDFNRVWSRMFNWGSDAINDWRYVDSVSFEGRGDREHSAAGWKGRNIDAIALKPQNGDVRCGRVMARFQNGWTQRLNVNRGEVLPRGRYYELDLPGRARDLASLNMRCRAVDGRQVTVQIYTSRR